MPGFGDDGPTLEIFTYAEMVETADSMANHLGYTHIAFEVDDDRKVYDKALKEGGIPLGKVTEKIVPGIRTLFFVYFKDPEGNIIDDSFLEQGIKIVRQISSYSSSRTTIFG